MDLDGEKRRGSKASRLWARFPLLRAVSLRSRLGLFGLLAAIGFLAFMFSAVSPYDDDVQQEFVQSNKPKQFSAASYKAAPDVHTFGVHRLPAVVSTRRVLITCCGVVRSDFIADHKVPRTISRNQTGDRSPPSRLS